MRPLSSARWHEVAGTSGPARGRRRRSAVAGALLALSLAGCGGEVDVGVDADCGDPARVDNPTLVLMAQAVPSATRIPCVRLVPASWRHGEVDVRTGRASFAFASGSVDSTDAEPLTVVLTATCDVSGATEVPTDEPGTRRYERLRQVVPAYVGDRFYVYEGGCTRLTFALSGTDRVQAVGEASLAVGLVDRDAVRAAVREQYDGRLDLDPPGSAGARAGGAG